MRRSSARIAARVISHFASGSGSTASAFPTVTDQEREVITARIRTEGVRVA
ncbi:MAG: hypothetical protein ABI776_10210 [Nocardioidaceae bacterium]